MAKIFIDTNKFLDFYRYKEENKEVLDKLAVANNIVLTQQIVDEFNRNRVSEIRRLLEKVETKEKSLNDGICNLEPFGIFTEEISELNKENAKLIRKIKDSFQPIKNEINSMLDDDSKDMVLNSFNKIIQNTQTKIIDNNETAYNLAVKRNRLGGVPRSDKNSYKYLTVCDEYIWESLLLESHDDIIFVTRDRTYLDNEKILVDEYRKKTSKTIKFMELVSTALKESGIDISEEAIEKEQQGQDEILFSDGLLEIGGDIGFNIDEIRFELSKLPPIEEEIIRFRFGLDDGKCRTLQEVSEIFNISREEVRKIEAKALRKLRNIYAHKTNNRDTMISL